MKHTIEAMTDLLFEVAETKARMANINHEICQMDHGNDDFQTYINPIMGKIEMRMVDALDLFFEEITDCECLASHMLYETGVIVEGGIEYRLTKRDEFDNFIAGQIKRKQAMNTLIKDTEKEQLEAHKKKMVEELVIHGRVLLRDVDYMVVKYQHGVRPSSADFFEMQLTIVEETKCPN